MKIIVFGNGSLLATKQHINFAIEASKKHKVTFLTHREDLLGVKHKNLKIIDIKNPVRPEDVDGHDVCIGFDQSVVPVISSYKMKNKCKAYCFFLDFPMDVVGSVSNTSYNLNYAQRFFYWLNLSLGLDGVFCTNTSFLEKYKECYNREAVLIDFAVDCDVFDINRENLLKNFVSGCCRIFSWKKIDLVLKALRPIGINYKHIYRSGDKNEIRKVIGFSKEIKGSADFYENVSDENKMKILANSALLVHAQTSPWFGSLAPIEAGVAGTPSIVFDLQVNRDLYEDSVIYTEKNNIGKLRKEIADLYNDKNKQEEYREKAHNLYKKRFTNERMTKRILDEIC